MVFRGTSGRRERWRDHPTALAIAGRSPRITVVAAAMAAARTSSSRARRRPGWRVGSAITGMRRATPCPVAPAGNEINAVSASGTRQNRTSVLSCRPAPRRSVAWPIPPTPSCTATATSRSSTGPRRPDDLVARAVELGLAGLAITDHQGLYGAVRFSTAAEAAGLHPVIGIEIELVDAAVAGPGRDRGPGAACLATRAAGRRCVAEPPASTRAGPPGPGPSAPGCPGIAGREGGPPGDRRGAARAAPPAARPGRDGLAEPVPAGVAGEPRRDEGRAGVHPGAARGARTRG